VPNSRILSGIKVIDFTQSIAGPHCTKLLAQHGAEVIKIESPDGDPARNLPTIRNQRSGCFIQHNIGKKNLCLDFTRPEAQQICQQLIEQADVVVENFDPNVMKQYNLDWETLKSINPDLIMCSISCFGQTGPLSGQPGGEYIGQAYSGILGSTGSREGYPALSGTAFGQVSTGAHAYGAIVSALFHKLHGGGGQHLDIALLDCLFSYHAAHVQMYSASDGSINPPRYGHHHALLSPLGIFYCQGHYIVIIAIGTQWENLLQLIGREDMLTDPDFSTLLSRGENQQAITQAIENWLESVAGIDEALHMLKNNHVPCAPVLSIDEVIDHPHMKSRGIVQSVDDPVFGEVVMPASPFRYSSFPEPLDLTASARGENNDEILQDQLGYEKNEIEQLKKAGICANSTV
jgi:CoA:oxalate CoA-transferase